MTLFRNAPRQDPLIVSITGVQIGQRILGVVGGDARLFLDAAARVGITGSAYALATDAAAVARVQETAVKHGVLVEAGPIAIPLPLPDASFDLALLDDRAPRTEALTTSSTLLVDVRRVLRPGGRIILAVSAPASALAGLFGFTPKAPDVAALLRTLQGAGFIAARLLASREGVGYVEAARPMTNGPRESQAG
jgi:ubiquinone/menaquinone biosynthesis C-methylase UbiE